jgi:hypothetical protein
MTMSSLLTEFPWTLSPEMLLPRLRLRADSRHAADFAALLQEAQTIGRPRAIYRAATVTARQPESLALDEVTFSGSLLVQNLADTDLVFPFLATCGSELATWGAGFSDMLRRFWADEIMDAALGAAVEALHAELHHLFNLADLSMMNPGSLADWPLAEQRPLFNLLDDQVDAVGIVLKSSGLMSPIKSVSGILFPSEHHFESCQLCPRLACPKRRMAYTG